ncbi:MAG: hypothetical protein ACLTW9_06865 [Enterocloster sp.]
MKAGICKEDLGWAGRGQVAAHGMRNAWLMAVAPTSSTSILSGTTAGLDPVMKRFYLEEKKNCHHATGGAGAGHQHFWLYKADTPLTQT